MRSQRWIGVLALSAIGAVVAVSPAGAGEVHQVKTSIKFLEVDRSDFRSFSGAIGTHKFCRDDRLATLWYKPTEDAPRQKLGTDETNAKGAFVIELDSMAIAGLYAVQIGKDVETDDGEKWICKARQGAFLRF